MSSDIVTGGARATLTGGHRTVGEVVCHEFTTFRACGCIRFVAWPESGVHIKAVADLLGHSSIAITGDVYVHTSDDTARAAAEGLAGRLGL
jgi:integrase